MSIKVNPDGSPDYFSAYYDTSRFVKDRLIPIFKEYEDSLDDALFDDFNSAAEEFIELSEDYLMNNMLNAEGNMVEPRIEFVDAADSIEELIDTIDETIPANNIVDMDAVIQEATMMYRLFELMDRKKPYNIRLLGHGAEYAAANLLSLSKSTWSKEMDTPENIDVDNMRYWFEGYFLNQFSKDYTDYLYKLKLELSPEAEEWYDSIVSAVDEALDIINDVPGTLDREGLSTIISLAETIYNNVMNLRAG